MKKLLPIAISFLLGAVVVFIFYRNFVLPEHAARVERIHGFLLVTSNAMWIDHDIDMINLLREPTEKNLALTRQMLLLRLEGRHELYTNTVSAGNIPPDILADSDSDFSDLKKFIDENKVEIEAEAQSHIPQPEETSGERRIVIRRD